MFERIKAARKEAANAHNALFTPPTVSEQLKAAETRVSECNQRLLEKDNEIAQWACTHRLHFDGQGAVASWPPERIAEFKVLNRNQLWNEFQAALKQYAELKESA